MYTPHLLVCSFHSSRTRTTLLSTVPPSDTIPNDATVGAAEKSASATTTTTTTTAGKGAVQRAAAVSRLRCPHEQPWRVVLGGAGAGVGVPRRGVDGVEHGRQVGSVVENFHGEHLYTTIQSSNRESNNPSVVVVVAAAGGAGVVTIYLSSQKKRSDLCYGFISTRHILRLWLMTGDTLLVAHQSTLQWDGSPERGGWDGYHALR